MGCVCPKCGAQLGLAPVPSCRCGARFSNYEREMKVDAWGCCTVPSAIAGLVVAGNFFGGSDHALMAGGGIGLAAGVVAALVVTKLVDKMG